MLVGILLVHVVVLNMVLSNIMYTRFRQLTLSMPPPSPPLQRGADTLQPAPLPPRLRAAPAPGLLVLVVVRTQQHPPQSPSCC